MAPISSSRALAVARAAIERLVAMAEPSGRFIYRYALNDPTFVSTIYSDVRHAGAVWGLADAVREPWDIPGLAPALERTARYMEERVFRPFGATGSLCVFDEGYIKLSGSALGVAAESRLFQRSDDDRHRDRIARLARHIVSQREADGDFLPARIPGPIAKPYPTRDDLTPGEAVMALALAGEATADRAFIDLAADSADRFAERDYLVGRMAHWVLYAIEALDRVAPSDTRLAYAGRIRDGLAVTLGRDDGMGTACMTEGLLAYARTLRARGERESEVQAMLAQVADNLSRQVRFFHPSGAFIMSRTRQEVRIDGILHHALGFLGYARMVEGR